MKEIKYLAKGLYLFVGVPWYQEAINRKPSIVKALKEIRESGKTKPEDWRYIIQALVGERT